MTPIRSIRRFILFTVLLSVVLGGFLTAWFNYEDSREQVEELFDAELAQMARVLQSIFNHPDRAAGQGLSPLIYEDFDDSSIAYDGNGDDGEDDEHEYNEEGHKYEKKLSFQVWGKDGKLLLQSRSAADNQIEKQPKGFHSIEVNGLMWRLFALSDQTSGNWIQVAQREDVRTELTGEIAEHLFQVPLIITPFLALLIWYLVGAAFVPLKRLSSAISERHMGNLSAVDQENVPLEIQELTESLNDLFTRVKEQAQVERRFTSDAAHELRTPLAAMKIQLQNSLRRIESDKAKDSLTKSLMALNRMIRLVEQLLLLSRLDATKVLENAEPVNLKEVLLSIVDELDYQIVEREIDVKLDLTAAPEFMGHSALIYSLFKNFIDNALRYTPDGGALSISLTERQFVIEDSGPGIPENELGEVFRRFYRVEGDCSQGEGLGLAICQKIVSLYGFDLQLKNKKPPETGLRVVLTFGIRR